MAYVLGEPTVQQYFDANGDPLENGTIEFFLTGTSTPTAVYSDSSGTSLGTSVTLNSIGAPQTTGGVAAALFFDSTVTYKMIRKDSAGTAIAPTIDPYNPPSIISGLGGAVGTVATIAALKALTGQSNNESVTVLGHASEGDGGGGIFRFDSGSSATDDNGIVFQPDIGSGRWIRVFGGAVNVQWYNATGDSSTDDLAAFDAAELGAVTHGANAVYIPALAGGNFYKLSDVWNILNRDNFTVYGDGPQSAIVSYNEAAANVIEVDSCYFFHMRGISLNGIVGGGNGLVIMDTSAANPSHYGTYENIWLQYFDLDALVVESGQSNTFTGLKADVENAHSIVTLTGGKTKGARQRGIYIKSQAAGHTNNQSFVNCVINSTYGTDAADYALQVGTAGGTVVGSFSWLGGLIQGGDSNLVYLRCKDGHIKNAHIEASFSATKYEITFDGAQDTVIEGGHGGGDVLFSNSANRCGLVGRKLNGTLIESTCSRIYLRDCSFLNAGVGPEGKVNDQGTDTEITGCIGGANASAVRYAVGDSIKGSKAIWMTTDMEEWLGGASPARPCGTVNFDPGALGGMTISREATTVRTGSFSLKQVTTTGSGNDYEQGSYFNLTPLGANMRYLITVWCYVSAGTASLRLWINSGATTSDYVVDDTGAWLKLQMTITPDAADTQIQVLLAAGKSSTVFWDSLTVETENFTPLAYATLTDVAAPILGPLNATGYHIPTYLATGTTAITNFSGQWVGKPFTLIFDASRTVTDNAAIHLSGGSNFSATADDTLTLVYDGTDGVFREVSRSVN